MSSVFGSVHILAMIAIQLLLTHSVSSLNLTNAYLHHKCSNTQGKYKQGSAFEKNLNLVLSTITSIGNFRDGFRYTEEGEDPNNVFVMFQCRGDSYWSKCPPCISTAVSGLRRRCPRNKGAIIWYDQCLLKISSVASFNKIDYENDFYLSNPNNMSDRGLFNKETSALLEKLAYKASDRNNLDGKQLVLYAAGEKRIGTKKVYAMVQCTKDLIFTKCFECLEGILRKFPQCCDGKRGGRVFGTSCNFRPCVITKRRVAPEVFAGAARKSIEAIAEWDRLTYLYERCVRSLSVEATNAKDAHEALAVEKEKVAQALADLARSQDDAKEMKRKYDESALDKMAELVQKRLDRIKAHIDDTKAAEPKFLEFNQVSGNIKTLEALVEGGEVEMKSDDTMLRLVADTEELEAEVKAFGITDLMDGDFDVRTLFAELSPDNRNSVPPPTEGEDLADGRGECEGQAGERIVGQTEVRDEIADARD
ncbi:hypothetical protein AXX17_AT4G24030 [Arabidopsis thaliana]|uniref:Gnk2-homologous domain-containing protein n=1 Tax=Arabidopsis thaliana TaxID=3702 RepID=A0A178UYI6_ARATH|nr:hypothetical protein AXX17_AT4G24030 [Arabidopsis thaliana]